MYKVIYPFADLLDDSHIYKTGDEFPRQGVIVKPERYAELEGPNNKIGRPLIVAYSAHVSLVGEEVDKTPNEDTKAVKKASTAKKKASKK